MIGKSIIQAFIRTVAIEFEQIKYECRNIIEFFRAFGTDKDSHWRK